MRILHTSDWHLGRKLGEHELLGEQARVIDWMVELVRAEGVDLVAVSGDVFDRSVPPAEAVTLWWDAVRAFRSAGALVAAIAGNHDGAERLAAAHGITDIGGVYLRGGYGQASAVEVLEFADGPLALVTTPFLEPCMAPSAFVAGLGLVGGEEHVAAPEGPVADPGGSVGPGTDGDGRLPLVGEAAPVSRRPRGVTHERVLAAALDAARAKIPSGTRSLVLAHAFVTGAAPSSSERDLAVGDAGMVSAEVFAGFDYVALGHLHRPQAVGSAGHVRYSGSPLAYSFGERDAKQVVLVDIGADGSVAVQPRPVTAGRRAVNVRGTLDALCTGEGNTADWVRAELTDTLRPNESAARLQEVFPHLVEVAWVGDGSTPRLGHTSADFERRSPTELAHDFWVAMTGTEPDAELGEILAVALDARDDEEKVA